MRRFFEEMEQLRRIAESPLQQMMEQEERLRQIAEPLSSKLGLNSRLHQDISATTSLAESTSRVSEQALNSPIQQAIKQQERLGQLTQPMLTHAEKLSLSLPNLSMAALNPRLTTIAEQITVLDSLASEINAIRNLAVERFRIQDRWTELYREIREEPESIEPLHLPLPPKVKRRAQRMCKQLKREIRKAEAQIKTDEMLVVYCLIANGEAILVKRIAYQNPNLIIFYGFDTQRCEHRIICHTQNVHLHIKVVKDPDPEDPHPGWIQ